MINDASQKRYISAVALQEAAKSEAGQLYHRHVWSLLDEYVDRLLGMGIGATDAEVAAVVRQMQGVMKCMEWEGDAIHKGLQQAMRLADRRGCHIDACANPARSVA